MVVRCAYRGFGVPKVGTSCPDPSKANPEPTTWVTLGLIFTGKYFPKMFPVFLT